MNAQLESEVTLTRFLLEQQRGQEAFAEGLIALINDVRLACKRIACLLGKGALVKSVMELEAEVGQATKIQQLADDIFVNATEWGGQLGGMLSAFSKQPYEIAPSTPQGRYLLLFSPLNGAQGLDRESTVGSMFSILRGQGSGATKTSDYLQRGREQLCAGYAIYGPATMLVLTTGRGVHGFTLDREIGEFLLTHPDMQIPRDSNECVINVSHSKFWEPAVKRYVNECLAGRSGPRGQEYSLRWVASRVVEMHRILLQGGVYLDPRDRRDPAVCGHVPLLFEANPLAFLIEQAGGRASNGHGCVLDQVPGHPRESVGLIFGSASEVERIERYHRDHNDYEIEAPLFGSRGLFTGHP
jgi:fructose-1,6-bisphosphatase I/sedoheptulose-1,7-bisphosphatase